MSATLATWTIGLATVVAILVRPRRIHEAVWAAAGAVLVVVCGLLSPAQAGRALTRGIDVYLFLIGMMLLAETLREYGTFAWLASCVLRIARGSQARLFALTFAAGIVVTAFLSNDATVVGLTPAVLALARGARVRPLPYVFACAFVANAASFILPISNPANLVVFGGHLPRLGAWLGAFGAASAAALAATFVTLAFLARRSLRAAAALPNESVVLEPPARRASIAVASAAVILVGANAAGLPLGLTTFALACAIVALVATFDRRMFRGIAAGVHYAIVPLVAGLFVVAAAFEHGGELASLGRALAGAERLGAPLNRLAIGGVVTVIANVVNNLPAALVAGSTLSSARIEPANAHAILVAIDAGPNVAVSGSLATLLWLTILRREGIQLSRRTFLRVGTIVALPALVLALLVVR